MVKKLLKQYLKIQKLRKGKRSYSQSGEDLIISYAFRLKGILNPSYIDIGAFHPFDLSNTALFYYNGSTGINIEPNIINFRLFEKFRQRDLSLNIGLGTTVGQLKYYSYNNPSLNTFSETEAGKMAQLYESTNNHRYKLKGTYNVDVLSINQILKSHFKGNCPDFLSIDVEGMDLEILKSLDFNVYIPKIICVESVDYSIDGTGNKRSDILSFLESMGYFEYAFTNINSIMVNKEFWRS
jgi:FkbM family methyltransferase